LEEGKHVTPHLLAAVTWVSTHSKGLCRGKCDRMGKATLWLTGANNWEPKAIVYYT
jgi:hypothetical protein